jgi:Carbohydrate-selective porin, OprB family
MRSFIHSLLTRSAFLGVLAGVTLVGLYSTEGAASPKNAASVAVEPTHWSFQAIQSLAERYHCAPNTSDTLNRKDATISRYEMAAVLNTCLHRIGDRFVNQKDLETAQALQKEFKPELTALKDRVDFLENRAATLEPQQFSTTTKLQGQAVVTFQGGGFR